MYCLKFSTLFFLGIALGGSTLVFSQSSRLETVVQKGHSASVKAVTVSPDGKYLATGSRDRSAKLWDMATGMEIRTFLGHEHTVNAV
ncbi:MAG: hypothetical protein K2Q22_07885, partial [Cytophagales bacterium]|nr:hypothetical protein [Cytophagales bacterium]